ncbi:Hypothetical protein [Lactobacillus plantarum ZJ316] [Lactiplantibacillus mudanjiangensis]|nr:Hypothetical protein [Lactobacillus plantarum ZJ316] [Lactiplantibacillus mudanjiangensis]
MINQTKNTYQRVQPLVGTRLKDNQIKLRAYHTPRLSWWQQLKGSLHHA